MNRMGKFYTLELIEKRKRTDGRKFDEFRKIEIVPNAVKTAEGSALVSFGETKVLAGVKMELSAPFTDTPDEGTLMVNAEFTPLASPDFEAGPPGEEAVELARVVDRGIRESKAIDLPKLCITPSEKVWGVALDIHVINHQGNLLDCSALASLVALLNTKMPKLEGDSDNAKIVYGEYTGKLPIMHKPININVCKVGNNLLIDPTFEEEKIIDSKLAVAVREDDKICALQKQGSKEFTIEDVNEMADIAIKKSKELRKLVK